MDLKTLARLARSRFPGAYDDIDDDTLGAAYAKKHNIPVENSSPAKEMGVMSGIKSLGLGYKETVLPTDTVSDVVTGPAYALRHPIDSAKLLFGAAQDASQDQFEKMYAAPTKTEALARAVSGAVPFLGPGVAASGERIGQFGAGDTDEGMRGIGNALGILTGGKAVEKGAGLVRGAMQSRVTAPPPPLGAGASLDPSAMPSVPMMASEAAGHRTGGGILAKAFESSIPGAAPFERFRRAQQDALIDGLGAETTGRMAQPGADLSPYPIGDVLKQALQNATDDTRKGLHRGYAKLNKEMKGTLVDLAPVKDVISQRLAEMKNPILPKKKAELSALKLVKGGDAAPSKTGLVGPDGAPAVVEAPAAQGVPFIDARKFRTEIREGRHPIHPDFVEPVVNATTEALKNAAQSKGQLARMDRLDKGWANWEKTFNSDGSTVVKMRDKLPRERTHTEIVGASLDDINTIKNAVGPESFRDVKARLLQDIIEEAMSGELDTSGSGVVGKVRGANDALNNLMVERSPRRVSGKKVRNILEDKNRFGEDRLRAVFDGPKEYEAVMHFANTAEKVGATPSSLVGAFINAGLIGELMSGTGKALYGDVAGAAGNFAEAAAMYGGVNLGSRMMTGQLNPKRLLSRVVSKPGGAKAMSNYIEALSKKNGTLPESIRFRVPDKTARGKAYFWGRIVGKMAKDEAERMEKDGGNE